MRPAPRPEGAWTPAISPTRGLTVLLQREWWDRTRVRLQHRWRPGAVDSHPFGGVPAAALLTPLAPVLTILAVTAAE